MQKEIQLPEFIVMRYGRSEWQFMGKEETIMDIMKEFREDAKEDEIKDELVGQEFKIYYDARAYMSREERSCGAFDHLVRPFAPYAPIFRGNIVILSRYTFFLPTFQNACASLWETIAPREEIPEDVKDLASRLGMKIENEEEETPSDLSKSVNSLKIE